MVNRATLIIIVIFFGSICSQVDCLECYTCNSKKDSDCATKPGKQIEVEECDSDEFCVTVIINGLTQRGCFSKVLPNKHCDRLCETCNISLCNGKIFPPERLRCYQCSGSSCVNPKNNTKYTALPCPIYKTPDRCYTNIISDAHAQRGCEASDPSLVDNCKNICLKCNYDGCNDEDGLTHHYCYECSFIQSPTRPQNYDCIRAQHESDNQCKISNLKTCYNKVLYGHKGQCFFHVNEALNVVARGCSSNMGFYPTGNLTECYGNYCNADCHDIMCNVCDTTSDPECRNRTHVLKAHRCEQGTASCFSCEDEHHLWRGCGSKMPSAKSNQVCYTCRDAHGCNKESIRSCYKCSSIDNAECATWNDISNITIANCTNPAERCVSTLFSRLQVAYTARGCESDVPECAERDPFCTKCNGSLCNFGPKFWITEPRVKQSRTWQGQLRDERSNAGSWSTMEYHVLLLVGIHIALPRLWINR